MDFSSENPQKLIFQRANFQFFHICEKSVKVRKIRFPAQIGMDCPVEKPLWATKSHHKQPSYAGSKTDRFAIFGPKFRIFFKFWPTTCPFVGGFVWSNFLIKAHGQPVPMVPNPGKSGNRFTRIFNRENWSKMQILPILTQLWPALAGKPVDQFQPLRWPRTGLEGLFKDQLWANDRKHKRANCGRPKNLRQLIASRPC